MVRIAQLTDLHLVERDHGARRGVRSWRLSFLSAHRDLDADDRITRATLALAAVAAAGVDHLVITGDLTEDGTVAQFEVLAEMLHACGVAAAKITLVPGNHDVIDRRDGWARALEGPLRAFAATSQLGRPFDVGDLTILPVNTAFYQHWVMSAGRIGPAHAGEVADAIALGRARGRVVLLAQHHPVTTHRNPVVHWVDGLRDHAKARSLLRDEPHVHVMHGHTHRRRDRSLDAARAAQVFSACAVVDGDAPLRVYACVDGVLRGADIAGDLGALRR